MGNSFLIIIFCFLAITSSFGQSITAQTSSANRIDIENTDSWTLGVGFNNFIMHGDLRSMGTSDGTNYWNFGGYVYIDKMFNPLLGLEGKLSYMKMSGGAQQFNNDAHNYTPSYITTNNPTSDSFVTDLNHLIFEGTSVGGELNAIISLSDVYRTVPTNWHAAGYFGVGYHFYNSRLGEKNLMPNENGANANGEKFFPDADFGFNPRKNTEKKAVSIYLSAQFGLKRRISNRIDLEFRTGMYFNCEDHLDAAISRKQNWENFFVSSLGVAFKFGTSKRPTPFVDQELHSVDGGDLKIVDSDGDGVMDQLDVAANTPPGVMVYGNGKPIDSDGDGVPDYKDKCVLEFGAIADEGCPESVDSDGDGVEDRQDLCPNIPGLDSNKGCPQKGTLSVTIDQQIIFEASEEGFVIVDSDGDGLADYKDKCAFKYGPIANEGCPRKEPLTGTIQQQIALLATSIYFDTNSDQIKRISFATIDKIVKLMKQMPDVKYIIEGHTDNTNSEAYNLELSKRRVASVKKYMVSEGIPERNLKTKGYGESKPKFTNKNAGGRQLNRRVEIKPINSLE